MKFVESPVSVAPPLGPQICALPLKPARPAAALKRVRSLDVAVDATAGAAPARGPASGGTASATSAGPLAPHPEVRAPLPPAPQNPPARDRASWGALLAAQLGGGLRALGAGLVAVWRALSACLGGGPGAKAPPSGGRALSLQDPAALGAAMTRALAEPLASVDTPAVLADGSTLPVVRIFQSDLGRCDIAVGGRPLVERAGARTPAQQEDDLRRASAGLLALCDQDPRWAQRLSGALSQNVGNTLMAVVRDTGLVRLGEHRVLTWAQRGGGASRLSFSARRRGDAVEVTFTLRGQLAQLMLDGPAGARMVPAQGPVRLEVVLAVPAGDGPIVCERAQVEAQLAAAAGG